MVALTSPEVYWPLRMCRTVRRLPYRIFAFDSAMTDVVRYAQAANKWMKAGGRALLAKKLGITA